MKDEVTFIALVDERKKVHSSIEIFLPLRNNTWGDSDVILFTIFAAAMFGYTMSQQCNVVNLYMLENKSKCGLRITSA